MTLAGKATKFDLTATQEYGGAYPNGPFTLCSARFTSAPTTSWQPDIQFLHMPLSNTYM